MISLGRAHVTALSRIQCYLTIERLGEDLLNVALLAGGYAAVRQACL